MELRSITINGLDHPQHQPATPTKSTVRIHVTHNLTQGHQAGRLKSIRLPKLCMVRDVAPVPATLSFPFPQSPLNATMLQLTDNPPPPSPGTPQWKNGERKPIPILQHVPRRISTPGGSIIVRVSRPARSRRLGAAVSHRSRSAVVPSAGPRRRRPGRGGRCRVCTPAARPGRRGRGVQRTRGRRIERARRGSVERCAGGGGS